MKKILLLGSQHGNELLGEYLYDYIAKKRPHLTQYVSFAIGNPEAKKRRVRYIESDLNRSFNGKNNTYEERRANELRIYIDEGDFSLVLDLHTTTCKQPPCIITASTGHHFIQASSIAHVVHMSHEIVRTSLIGVCKEAISIEVNKDKAQDEAILGNLCDDIERFLLDQPASKPQQTYRVNELLKKSDIPSDAAIKLRNFHKSTFGFYPVLVGENSYKKQTDYLGFKAYKVRGSKV